MHVREKYETLMGEGLKSSAEVSLQHLGRSALGAFMLEKYSARVVNPRLNISLFGEKYENPVMVGAGWDKQGRALHGLYHLGFGGVEVGTVTPRPQPGNSKPRLFTIDKHHSVGLNRMGFNSPGVDVVDHNLDDAMPLPFPIGVNIGRNKDTPNELTHEDHKAVMAKLAGYASYLVLGISSPNTPNLRGLQDKEPLRELIQSAKVDMPVMVPLLIKIDAERSEAELHDMIEVGLEEGLAGFVACNTYSGSDLKAYYGERWANEPGGLSGADVYYQNMTTRVVRRIYEEAGDQLVIIGAGGVNNGRSALDKIWAGASAVQVVTAMRPSWGRVANTINKEILSFVDHMDMPVRAMVGLGTKRGPKI